MNLKVPVCPVNSWIFGGLSYVYLRIIHTLMLENRTVFDASQAVYNLQEKNQDGAR